MMHLSSAPRWRRRAEARPDEILDAAISVFTSKGFDAARIEDIAGEAGLSKGAIYLYFDSKDALLKGLIEREVAPVAARISALADAGVDDPAGAIRKIVETPLKLFSNKRFAATPQIVLSVAARFPHLAEFYRERVVDVGLNAIARLHAAGVQKKLFRPINSEIAASAVIGPIRFYVLRTHLLRAEADADLEARANATVDILLEGLRA
jgi:AcrR family transcriptional regulator